MRPVESRRTSRWRMVCNRGVALAAAALSALLVASAVAAGDDGDPPGDPFIPPGEEGVIAAMLGRGMTFHDCTFIGGGVRYTVIVATYRCLAAGDVTLELGHPRDATVTSTRTGQFAITLQSGTPPSGFQDALASLVRSREGAFEWSWPEYDAAPENDGADDDAAE